MPTYLLIRLKLILQILPVIQIISMYVLGIGGVTMTVLSVILILRIFNRQQSQQEQEINRVIDNPDLRMPLCYGQYTSISILPSTIKRITTKTDLFS